MKTRIIYIPGLGDHYDGFRKFSLKWWNVWGVNATHVPITWYDGGDFEQKMGLVNRAIDAHNNERIVVIGESAGGALALHTASNPKVSRVITLCGVSSRNTPISSYLEKRAPALVPAARTIPDVTSYDVHSVRAYIDPVVGAKYNQAAGAKVYTIPLIGHFIPIVLCLTILAPLMVTIAKKSKT